jgi:hypothetical protein
LILSGGQLDPRLPKVCEDDGVSWATGICGNRDAVKVIASQDFSQTTPLTPIMDVPVIETQGLDVVPPVTIGKSHKLSVDPAFH